MSGKQAKRMRAMWAAIPEDERKQILSEMGKVGGKRTIKKRFNGMSTEERSDYMKRVRSGIKINV